MIGGVGPLEPATRRVFDAPAVRACGEILAPISASDSATIDLVIDGASAPDGAALTAWLAANRAARLMVVSRVGAHPDARAAALRRLWDLEEAARASGLPTLTLRLAPRVGAECPLWQRLRTRPRLPRGGRMLLNPVAERDVIETVVRACDGRAAWNGWYEVAGPAVVSLAELAARARANGPALPDGAGAWEPALEEMAEHRLCESGPWAAHFGIVPVAFDTETAWAA